MTDPSPQEPNVRSAPPGLLSRISLVWLVPVLALSVSLGIAWQSYSDRGVLIEIAFENASGIVAEKTELKYRDVSVGVVTDVTFTKDLSEVVAAVRVDRTVAPYLDGDARFWVVRPEVSLRGVSGLNTVLSGVFIEGTWDSQAGTVQTRFRGLDKAPLSGANRGGTAISLRARDGNSIAAGAPILHKGIPVGVVEAPQLAATGDGVVINAFIEAPYDRLITANTRFWDISGVSVSLGAGGVSLNFASLASLVEGGISFDTLVSGGDPVTPGAPFQLFANQAAARHSLLVDTTTERLTVVAVFDGAISGLEEGSDVRFRGVSVGEVSNISMVARDEGGRKVIRLVATLALRADMLGAGPGASAEETLDLLGAFVGQGLRGRLAKASILSSDLIVEMVELPETDPASLGTTDEGLPELPTAVAEIGNLNATAEGLLARINALPIEEMLGSARNLLAGADRLVNAEDTRAVAPELTATLVEARAALAELRQVLTELRDAGAAESLTAALVSAASAAGAVETAAGTLPTLAARLDALAARTDAVMVSATTVLDGLGKVVTVEGAPNIIPELAATLAAARSVLGETTLVLTELREVGATERFNEVLTSAVGAAAAVETAAGSLPQLVLSLDNLVARAETVLAAYGDNSRLINGTLGTLRDISEAADSLRTLARTLQRNPNSILLGR